jgi:hypothetical protein
MGVYGQYFPVICAFITHICSLELCGRTFIDQVCFSEGAGIVHIHLSLCWLAGAKAHLTEIGSVVKAVRARPVCRIGGSGKNDINLNIIKVQIKPVCRISSPFKGYVDMPL